ncbi:hypothetical protein Tco_0618017 [Tanacetum coccineum]
MQEAIEMATELMDQESQYHGDGERQVEKQEKSEKHLPDANQNNNSTPNKRQNTGVARNTDGSGVQEMSTTITKPEGHRIGSENDNCLSVERRGILKRNVQD